MNRRILIVDADPALHGLLEEWLAAHCCSVLREDAGQDGDLIVADLRIDARLRSQGLGRRMFEWAIERSRSRGCHLVQLTTDKSRDAAKRFYEDLGFAASHEGMKLRLNAP